VGFGVTPFAFGACRRVSDGSRDRESAVWLKKNGPASNLTPSGEQGGRSGVFLFRRLESALL
jgi:hypothetical protein